MAFLWEDKSGDKLRSLGNTGDLLGQLVNMKVMMLMIGATVLSAIDNKLIALAITTITSLMVYIILQDFFERFWHGFNRSYAISYDGIHFHWGLRKKLKLFVPYSSITKVTLVPYTKSALSTIYFDTNDKTILNKYPHLATDDSFKLSFDMIKEGDQVVALLNELRKEVKIIGPHREVDMGIYAYLPLWLNKLYSFVAFAFICYSTFTLVSVVDSLLPNTTIVETVITKQKNLGHFNHFDYHKIETQAGYTFHQETPNHLIGNSVTLEVTPIFSNVINIKLAKQGNFLFLSPFYGLSIISKILSLIISLLIGLYILYRRGFISIEDVGLFIVFPVLLITISHSLLRFSYLP